MVPSQKTVKISAQYVYGTQPGAIFNIEMHLINVVITGPDQAANPIRLHKLSRHT